MMVAALVAARPLYWEASLLLNDQTSLDGYFIFCYDIAGLYDHSSAMAWLESTFEF